MNERWRDREREAERKKASTRIEEEIPCFVNHLLSFKNTLFRFFYNVHTYCVLLPIGICHDCVKTKAKVVYDVIHTIQTVVNMLCKYVCRYAKLNGIESNWMSDM